LFRCEITQIRIIEGAGARLSGKAVGLIEGEIVIRRGKGSLTPVARTLENWLRRQARAAIEVELAAITSRLGQHPKRVYVMGQRTKWGNCSALKNLSFNWRLILAPQFVLRYLVTHEAVHLAVPDHSAKFWLTVQSLCPETERAKQWLWGRGEEIGVNL
jgi:predicted metal-dependent hydrolase